jgi:hypothetical protein
MLIRKENYGRGGARGGGITRPVGRGGIASRPVSPSGRGGRGQHWDGHDKNFYGRRNWPYNRGYGPYGRYYNYPLYNYPVYDQIYTYPTTSYDCPTMYHYDKSHIKADINGCVKDSDTCELGSKFQPNNPNSDSRGCMKDLDMPENFTSSSASSTTEKSSSSTMYTLILVGVLLGLAAIFLSTRRR